MSDKPHLKARTPMDRRAFRKAHEERGEAPNALLRKVFGADITKAKNGDDEDVYKFIISTDSPDRYKDVVSLDGWELDNFKKGGGAVLFAHDYWSPPVAKCVACYVEKGTGLVGELVFPEKGMDPLADVVKGHVDFGSMKSTSVGFIPRKLMFNDDRGGYDFEEQELLEFSIVPVPANPEAVQLAAQNGVEVEPLLKWIMRTLDVIGQATDEPLDLVRRAHLETVAKSCGWEPAVFSQAELPEIEAKAAPEPVSSRLVDVIEMQARTMAMLIDPDPAPAVEEKAAPKDHEPADDDDGEFDLDSILRGITGGDDPDVEPVADEDDSDEVQRGQEPTQAELVDELGGEEALERLFSAAAEDVKKRARERAAETTGRLL